jgi:hypothetical protein
MNCCEIDGATCFPPDDSHSDAIGWLNAIGDTMEECVEKIKEHADKLPDGVDADTDALVDVINEVHSMKEEGIPFTDQSIPDPTEALNI